MDDVEITVSGGERVKWLMGAAFFEGGALGAWRFSVAVQRFAVARCDGIGWGELQASEAFGPLK